MVTADARSLAKSLGDTRVARRTRRRARALAECCSAAQRASLGKDAVLLGMPTRVGLGCMLRHDLLSLGPNPNAFGHPGAGGSIAVADPDAAIGFAYVMNQMQAGLAGDPLWYRLIKAGLRGLGVTGWARSASVAGLPFPPPDLSPAHRIHHARHAEASAAKVWNALRSSARAHTKRAT